MGTEVITKAKTDGDQQDVLEDVTTPEPEVSEPETPEPDATPEPAQGKGETKPESWEQKYKTLEGMHRKTNEELKTLKGQHLSFSEIQSAINQVSTTVAQQGDTLSLITDILSETAVDNEELGNKVKQAKQKQEYQQKSAKALNEIMAIAQQGGLKSDAPELEPAKQAFLKGDYDTAKSQTFLAVISKVKDGKLVKAETPAEKEPEKPKKKVPVITGTPGHVSDGHDLSPIEKIKRGIQERRDNE